MAALRAAAGLALCGAAASLRNTCTEEGVCYDSKGKAHHLSDLRGDHTVAGPMDGPGVQYVFNLQQNVQAVPAVCQRDEDFSNNAFRYDDETHVPEDSCRPLGCDLNPEHGEPGFGLLLTSSEGKLEFKYRSPNTPDFTATLTCVDDAEKNGVGAPGALEQADDESWTLSWETAYVCPGLCTGAPAANAEGCQPVGNCRLECLEGYRMSEDGSDEFSCTNGTDGVFSWSAKGGVGSTCDGRPCTHLPDPPSDGKQKSNNNSQGLFYPSLVTFECESVSAKIGSGKRDRFIDGASEWACDAVTGRYEAVSETGLRDNESHTLLCTDCQGLEHCDGGKTGRAAPHLTCIKNVLRPDATNPTSHCSLCDEGYRASSDDTECAPQQCKTPDLEHGSVSVKVDGKFVDAPYKFSGTKARPTTVATFGCDPGFVLLSAESSAKTEVAAGGHLHATCALVGGSDDEAADWTVNAPLCVAAAEVCGKLPQTYCGNGGTCHGRGDCTCAEGFEGTRCETATPSSAGTVVIAVAVVVAIVGLGAGIFFARQKGLGPFSSDGGDPDLTEGLNPDKEALEGKDDLAQGPADGDVRTSW
eukprot:COSAG04_NODE_3085_length_3185_cov_2.242385_1_plen_586_part_00